jgi:uncharacterized oxidoreductase
MKTTGNTLLITGGGSGIGRGLAEAFYQRGNTVIITGRRVERLLATCAANPGMIAVELDVQDPQAIRQVTTQIIKDHPALNVLINNAGIMELDDVSSTVDDEKLATVLATNIAGPIRMSGALVGHLRQQADAVIINVSSILGFVPLAPTAAYSATKAAIHSYTLSQRYLLRGLGIRVIEMAPPWVRTELLNSLEEERAMPLATFIEATMAMLATDADEILVGQAPQMRANPGPQEHNWVNQFNDLIAAGPPLGIARATS